MAMKSADCARAGTESRRWRRLKALLRHLPNSAPTGLSRSAAAASLMARSCAGLVSSIRISRLKGWRGRLHFAAIPTTTGTGSEASSAAVYTEEPDGHKVPVLTHDFLPDVVILDPRLTMGLSQRLTVLTALDALGHALEGYVSRLANPLVDGLAASAVAEILATLPEYLAEGESLEIRLKLQVAAFQAGQVQNHRAVGLAHVIAHQVGAFGVPHAVAVGTYLPASMRWACQDATARARYDRLARFCGLTDAAALILAVAGLIGQAGVAGRIGSLPGVPPVLAVSDCSRIVTQALEDPIARFLPVKIDASDLAAIIQQAW
jgi:alcohol dehydrogenase